MGQIRGQKDNKPQAGTYPTHLWQQGDFVQDEYEIMIAEDAPPGNYQFAIGMYTWETLERLPVIGKDGIARPEDRLLLVGPQILAPSQQ